MLLLASLWLATLPVGAEEASNEELYGQGVQALTQGDHGRAIAVFETLADRGFTHPDAAYNRGLSYLARVRAKEGRPGDLGRAAAGFEETLMTRPGDHDAIRAVELIQAEIARRGARAGRAEVQTRPSLDRVIVGAAPEAVWAWAAFVASLLLAVGLLLRTSRSGPVHMAGVIQWPIGLVGLILFATLAARARHVRTSLTPAVVVVAEARILDAQGAALPQEPPIPEAARLDVLERRAGLARVRYGQREAWTHGNSLRELPR
jgi:hypothetical protein